MSVVFQTSSPLAGAQPRTVSGGVTIGAYLGGRGAQCAWGVLFLCLIWFWYLAEDPGFSPLNGLWRLGPTVEVAGIVQSLIETDREVMGRTEWGTEMERVSIPGIHYGYVGPDNLAQIGVAMGLKHGYHHDIARVGAPVRVICSKSNPEKSYVKGLKIENEAEYTLKGAGFWLAVLAAGLSVVGVLHGLRRGAGLMRLLARGTIAEGKIVGIEPVPLLSQLGVRRLVYGISGSDNVEAGVWSSLRDEELTGEVEPIVHLPGTPGKAFPLSLIPAGIQIDENDHVSEGTSNPYNYLWLPTLSLLGYLWFVLAQCGLMSPPWVF